MPPRDDPDLISALVSCSSVPHIATSRQLQPMSFHRNDSRPPPRAQFKYILQYGDDFVFHDPKWEGDVHLVPREHLRRCLAPVGYWTVARIFNTEGLDARMSETDAQGNWDREEGVEPNPSLFFGDEGAQESLESQLAEYGKFAMARDLRRDRFIREDRERKKGGARTATDGFKAGPLQRAKTAKEKSRKSRGKRGKKGTYRRNSSSDEERTQGGSLVDRISDNGSHASAAVTVRHSESPAGDVVDHGRQASSSSSNVVDQSSSRKKTLKELRFKKKSRSTRQHRGEEGQTAKFGTLRGGRADGPGAVGGRASGTKSVRTGGPMDGVER